MLLIALLVTAFVLALGSALGAAPAYAHDELVASDPADGSTVDALPAAITLTYSGDLIADGGATAILVTDAAGADLTAGDPVVDGRTVTQSLEGSASGTVTITWKVVSGDGHPISGELVFGVGEAPQEPQEPPMTGTDMTWLVYAGIGAVGIALIVVIIVLVARSSRTR